MAICLQICSFAWMLAEAIYLNWLLHRATACDAPPARAVLVGFWLVPALITLLYGTLVEVFESEHCMCVDSVVDAANPIFLGPSPHTQQFAH